jgi:RNA polymerase sigma factor (sigma-70 family)
MVCAFKSEELFKAYKEPILRYVRSLTRDEDAAKDISQELWVRVLQHEGQFEDDGHVKRWLFTIARNLVTDFRRTRKRKPVESLDNLSKRDRKTLGNDGGRVADKEDEKAGRRFEPRGRCTTPEAWSSTVEEDEKIEALLLQIEPPYRAGLDSWLHGLTIGEIAEKTNMPLSAVKARFYRGKSRLLEATHTELEAKW